MVLAVPMARRFRCRKGQAMPVRLFRHLALIVLAFALAMVLIGFLAGRATAQDGAHGNGHAEMHEKYKSWTMPGNPNSSCCNNEDCRPTRADPPGGDHPNNWRAWNGTRWLDVPPERVLPTDFAGDGRSHLCE